MDDATNARVHTLAAEYVELVDMMRGGQYGGWQRFVDSAAIEHNVQELGLKAGITDEFAGHGPGYRQS